MSFLGDIFGGSEGGFSIRYGDKTKLHFEPSEDELTEEQSERYAMESSDECSKAGLKTGDDDNFVCKGDMPTRWRSPLFMPKWAARIWLEITGIRAEKVPLNAKRGFGWDTNPWVWVIEFKRIRGIGR